MKHINFLSGLPRSGSTLLGTLLNQHPKIYASAHSALLDGLWVLRETFATSDAVAFNLRVGAYQETLWTVPQTLYRNIEKDLIFDKNFSWGIPENVHIAQNISTNPRFIFIYRPVLEVLASFVSKAEENPSFYLNKELDDSDFNAKHYMSRNDAMAEFLMMGKPQLPRAIFSLLSAKQNEHTGMFKFVTYDDLVEKTQATMTEIFEFLGLEDFIIPNEIEEDLYMYMDYNRLGIKNFHRVRRKISNISVKPEELFSEFILEKYNNALPGLQ
jgi:sulfotransferase